MQTRTFTLPEIKRAIRIPDLMRDIEEGFKLYSRGEVVVPPVGHLNFPSPPGDVHIKYGYVKGGDYYVIKVASGFYDNPAKGLPSSNGLMLIFSQKTGEVLGVLLDEGHLTDVRTAVAGAIAAKYMAPKRIRRIGIVGTGIQAHLQLELLGHVTDCKDVVVYGRNPSNLEQYKADMEAKGFRIATTQDTDELAAQCNLIVTTTPSTQPLLCESQIPAGAHITAVGADSHGKQELDSNIFERADLIVADSITQCADHGEIVHALTRGLIGREQIVELGRVIEDPGLQRANDDQITVADLTGVAIQDIQIATSVFANLSK